MKNKNKTTADACAMTAEARATFTLIVSKPNGKTIYRNENLTKEQAENLSGLNTLKLQNKFTCNQ